LACYFGLFVRCGQLLHRVVYLYRSVLVLSTAMSVVWVGFLIGKFVPDEGPADEAVLGSTTRVPWITFVFYGIFVCGELLAIPLSLLTGLTMWRPVKRQSRLFKDSVGVPRSKPWKWPLVDVYIYHDRDSSVAQTIATLRRVMDLDWPKDRLHIYVLDDAYYRHGPRIGPTDAGPQQVGILSSFFRKSRRTAFYVRNTVEDERDRIRATYCPRLTLNSRNVTPVEAFYLRWWSDPAPFDVINDVPVPGTSDGSPAHDSLAGELVSSGRDDATLPVSDAESILPPSLVSVSGRSPQHAPVSDRGVWFQLDYETSAVPHDTTLLQAMVGVFAPWFVDLVWEFLCPVCGRSTN
jgi:hypothetical protein